MHRLLAAARPLAVAALLAALVTAAAPGVIRVRPGDTLSEIAQRHHTSVGALLRLNDLPGNGTLYAGQLLRVPGAPGAPSGRTVERGYTVRPGDTVSGIAQRYGVSSAALVRRNHLPAGGRVLVGRRLAIPVPAGSPGAATNAGVRIPSGVLTAAERHRTLLRHASVPSRATVRRMVSATARRHGVSPSLALAVAYHESGFQQRVVSRVDAIGVMQVLPGTARVLSRQQGRRLDLLNTQDNIIAGVLLLRQLLRSTGSVPMALAGYYQGLGSIARQGMLPQTRQYIANVSALRPRFSRG